MSKTENNNTEASQESAVAADIAENSDNAGINNHRKTVTVYEDQLQALVTQNFDLKEDIVALVNVFQEIAGVFNGKSGLGSIIKVVTSLIKNDKKMAELSHIVPIIDKYIAPNPENNG